MTWTVPQHSRTAVNQAAEHLLAYDEVNMSESINMAAIIRYLRALPIINNWRSSHSYPLNVFQVTLRRYARKVDDKPLIAQRIKRLSSITHKLHRFPDMKLSQMQDIGGCRAVVRSIGATRQLASLYERSNIKHERASFDDYISMPKASGYRGIHLVYRYYSDKNKIEYNGLKIEVQLRSQYMHAWATAVETVGTFVQQALKSSIGEDEWLRFFALMGTAIAVREKSEIVPGTPSESKELLEELKYYAERLDVENRLRAYGAAMQTIRGEQGDISLIDDAHYYLLVLDTDVKQLTISAYPQSQFDEASTAYLQAEERTKNKVGTDAVLVSVDSLAALERAYPNYFADTRVFLKLMDQALSGKRRRVNPPQLKFPFV